MPARIATAVAQGIVQMDPRPTALLVDEGSRATNLYHALRKLGCEVPRDLSILTFTAETDPSVMMPGMTAVLCSTREMTVRAVGLVPRLLRSARPVARTEQIVPVFVPGRTTRLLSDPDR